LAAARHQVTGVRTLAGATVAARGPARVVTATGNPEAVAASAREAGFAPVTLAAYRDHHWFGAAEARRERAAAAGATLLLTAKDAVRWPAAAGADGVAVLEVAWRWRAGGERVERLVFEGED
ncbi:MAG TPA: tetraacyldisaccharide 4'-kinase, partial [Candidatus Eisenbacteria bacterium]|nr:tetraacyldisaccharide 4'-kinase [Candidatus Eisenbacteria bacterium]